jgi:hypothetical protein
MDRGYSRRIFLSISERCRLVLYDKDSVYDAEGYITALSYGATLGEPIENALTFQIDGRDYENFRGMIDENYILKRQ